MSLAIVVRWYCLRHAVTATNSFSKDRQITVTISHVCLALTGKTRDYPFAQHPSNQHPFGYPSILNTQKASWRVRFTRKTQKRGRIVGKEIVPSHSGLDSAYIAEAPIAIPKIEKPTGFSLITPLYNRVV
jgi:hypothetical protein